LGKISVGDNSTLTTLVQGVIAEIVMRITVEVAYPILGSLDFYNGQSPSAPTPKVVHAKKSAMPPGPDVDYTGSVPQETTAPRRRIDRAPIESKPSADVIARMSSPFLSSSARLR
jgi:hypothetical protein